MLSGDNYIHLVRRGESLAVIDPGSAGPVREYVERSGTKLDSILLTHGHHDHTGGCAELTDFSGCRIIGPVGSALTAAQEGDDVEVCGCSFKVLATPGHTSDHLCFYSAAAKIVFTGDTLFHCGCGRVFTGDYAGMWRSLDRLRKLPGDTHIYCGHNYTSENIDFALSVDPANEKLARRARRQTFSSIELELATNPFLRPENKNIRAFIGLPDAPQSEVFAELRKMKDVF